MPSAQLTLHPAFTVAQVDSRIFGSFLEHLGRCIYGGIYEPGHTTASEGGFRGDVLEMIREINVPVVRYPGGNFVSGYDWKDGIGPKESRPSRLELAWRSIENNQFGTNEFIDWCRAAGTEPLIAVNLGTGSPESAAQLVEYCNHPGGSYWSDLRISHGWEKPHKVKYWCLGNEMDGPWQIGHKTATEYGRVAAEAAKLMKLVDPEIELVACGSSGVGLSTYLEWDQEILNHLYDYVDHISLHNYLGNGVNKFAKYLSESLTIDRQIKEIIAVCDLVQARKKGKKQINLSFDEWNVWYHSGEQDKKVTPWTVAPPLIEDHYTLEDALVVGCILITLLRHADRIKIACLAQLVNVIAPIFTKTGGGSFRQTTFYPYRDASRFGRGEVLQANLTSDQYEVEERGGPVDLLEMVPVLDRAKGELTIFAVNRHLTDPLQLQVDVRAFSSIQIIEHSVLDGPDNKARNTFEEPFAVQPRLVEGTTVAKEGSLEITFPPVSWNVVRFAVSLS